MQGTLARYVQLSAGRGIVAGVRRASLGRAKGCLSPWDMSGWSLGSSIVVGAAGRVPGHVTSPLASLVLPEIL